LRVVSARSTLRFPEGWTLSRSWQRARTERDRGGPINDAERMVYLIQQVGSPSNLNEQTLTVDPWIQD